MNRIEKLYNPLKQFLNSSTGWRRKANFQPKKIEKFPLTNYQKITMSIHGLLMGHFLVILDSARTLSMGIGDLWGQVQKTKSCSKLPIANAQVRHDRRPARKYSVDEQRGDSGGDSVPRVDGETESLRRLHQVQRHHFTHLTRVCLKLPIKCIEIYL